MKNKKNAVLFERLYKVRLEEDKHYICPYFTNYFSNILLILEKAVKTMVYPNGKHQNLGCTKLTKSCKETAHFDRKRNLRINVPPCCQRLTLEVLDIVTKELQRMKVMHFLVGGAVLGWARNKLIVSFAVRSV